MLNYLTLGLAPASKHNLVAFNANGLQGLPTIRWKGAIPYSGNKILGSAPLSSRSVLICL